jgi:hypothetical protein
MHLIRKTAPVVTAFVLVAGAAGATPFTVTSSITNGQTLTGSLRWTATVSTSDVSTVEFFVDGVRKTTERQAPYSYGGDQGMLDTTALSNGTHAFAVTATATDGTRANVSATATTKNAPVNTGKPSISGTARDGSTLSASRGSWTGPATISYAYRWLRCDSSGNGCATISGATGSSYRATGSDVGHRLRVVVTASNSAGATEATSDASSVVAARGNAPAMTSEPSISGTARDGSLLTASHGGWSNSPSSYAYQWLRCDANAANCAPIGGANARQYTVTTADVGRRIRIAVTASNSYGSGTATSNATGTIQSTGAAPASTSPPSIAGTLRAGDTVTVSNGGWSGSAPLAFAYSWRRCDSAGNDCVDIPGANSASYGVVPTDVRHTLRVLVTARNSRGASTATSGPSGVVTAGSALDVAQISLPNTLVIDGVRFSPNPLRSRLTPIVARFHVSDTRGFSIAGALVYALGVPYGWVRNAPEAMTDGAGWATVVMRPGATMPKRGALVVFVRARKPGESVLGGVTARRLVQEGIRRR